MELFKLKTKLHEFDTVEQFAESFQLGERDLIITNDYLYTPLFAPLQLKSTFIFKEKYGPGEPSDHMMNAMLQDVKNVEYDRIVAVGGGSVIDIAKLFVLQGLEDVVAAFERTMPLVKEKQLVVIPTTCGTGSEVTNISIAEIISKQTKMGLAVDELYPDDAVFIPELIRTLPYPFYVYSSIDALIHAIESHVSPKSNDYTKLYSTKAIELILDIYVNIAEKGPEYRFERLRDVLIASNYAGIAFGNTGVGAVHALSYPLGGNYHVPHGEANYQFFTEVFKVYLAKNPDGKIKEVNELLARLLHTSVEGVYDELDALLGQLLAKKPLHTYGMKEEEIHGFTQSVIEKQQRLLANNYVPLSEEEIEGIYARLY